MKWAPFILILFNLLACSKQHSQSTLTKLNFNSSQFAIDTGSVGMMYLIDKDRGQQKAIVLDGLNYSTNLNYGNWEFVVVAWLGDSINQSLRCGKVARKLSGPEVSLTIEVTSAQCNDNYFSSSDFRQDGTTKDLQFINCSDLSSISPGHYCEGSAKGELGSYRLKFLSHNFFNSTNLSLLEISGLSGLSSGCLAADANYSHTLSTFKVPYGSYQFHLPVVLEAYADANCMTEKEDYFFPHGLGLPRISELASSVISYDYGDVYLAYTLKDCRHNEVMTGLAGRSGGWLDQLGARCSIFENGNLSNTMRAGNLFGGNGGGPFNDPYGYQDCPAGSAISAISYYPYSIYSSQLSFTCRSVSDYQISQVYGPYGSWVYGARQEITCESGKFLRTFDFSAIGDFVGLFSGQFECR